MLDLGGIDQVAVADPRIVRQHSAAIAELAAFHRCQPARQHVVILKIERARRAEIAHIGVIWSFLVSDLLHQFGDQEIQVGIALAVRVAGHVDGNVVHAHRQVGAVVEIEAAQEILVGLSAAGMLGDDHAGNFLDHFAGAKQRTQRQIGGAHHALVGAFGDAAEVLGAARHHHGFQRLGRRVGERRPRN